MCGWCGGRTGSHLLDHLGTQVEKALFSVVGRVDDGIYLANVSQGTVVVGRHAGHKMVVALYPRSSVEFVGIERS